MKLSDFSGWVASDQNGQWKADVNNDFTLTAGNYNLYLDYRTNGAGVTNSFRGADALDAKGRLRLCEGKTWYGAALSKKKIPNVRIRLQWQDDIGTIQSGGEHTEIGFVNPTDAQILTYWGNPEVADGSGYGKTSRNLWLLSQSWG